MLHNNKFNMMLHTHKMIKWSFYLYYYVFHNNKDTT